MKKLLKKIFNALLPIALLAIGIAGMGAMIATGPEVEVETPEVLSPSVRVMEVEKQDIRLQVKTQGTVSPHCESIVTSEISGRVVEVNDRLVSGGFIGAGDVLIKLDKRDYELALISARAKVVKAKALLAHEEAEAEIARQEWQRLNNTAAPPLALHEPELNSAKAELEAAKTALNKAELNLERTIIKAPYDGCVRKKLVGLGQYVSYGTPIAQVYSVDYVEIRLPLTERQLGQLDYLTFLDSRRGNEKLVKVTLTCLVGSENQIWTGWIDRIEGHLNEKNRMYYAVARVDNPYGLGSQQDKVPLSVGLFVKAEIEGRVINAAAVIPRISICKSKYVMTIDKNNRLRFREIEIAYLGRENAIVMNGLTRGDKVCTSSLDIATEGMSVRTYVEQTYSISSNQISGEQ